MRGRVGSTVLRKGQRAVVASQYQPQVANPRSYAQAVQRCAFATATAAQKALYDIVDHSFEGLSSRRENLQEFVRVNSKKIAALVKNAPENAANVLNLKGVPGIQLAPLQVSRGSLAPVSAFVLDDTPQWGFERSFAYPNVSIASTAALDAALFDVFGVHVGEQLSLVSVYTDVANTTGAYTNSAGSLVRNVFSHVALGRLTFVSSLPADFAGAPLFVEGELNPAFVASLEGDIQVLVDENESAVTAVRVRPNNTASEYVGAAALIRSSLSERGFLYSTASLSVREDVVDMVGGDYLSSFVESYQASAASFASDYYLDNAI